jgi:hypothetical protein
MKMPHHKKNTTVSYCAYCGSLFSKCLNLMKEKAIKMHHNQKNTTVSYCA